MVITGKYNTATIFTNDIEEEAIQQIKNLCNLSYMRDNKIVVMPDVHAGAGCTIGTTIKLANKKLVPNLVGVDIGCGVLTTIFKTKDQIDFEKLERMLREKIPTGMNIREKVSRFVTNTDKEHIKEVCQNIKKEEEYDYHCKSLGTLGGGNHYLEIGKDNDTYYLTVHTGSRNLGLKVCECYQKLAVSNKKIAEQREIINYWKEKDPTKIQAELAKYKDTIKNTDTEYVDGNDFDRYIHDMQICQNLALRNREIISKKVINCLENLCSLMIMDSYDTIHNYLDLDTMIIRKGAISAQKDERLTIPLNMSDGIIIGIGKGNEEWNFSAPHGAGRKMSRKKARDLISMNDYKKKMKNINTWSVEETTVDEAPQAYKPAKNIINSIQDTVNISKIVKPIYNFKAK